MKKAALFFVLFAIVISCGKKPAANPTAPLVFSSLVISPDTIHIGNTATIVAHATGSNITYKWSTNHGDLFGSGSSIFYGSQPCCAGTNTVTCVVTDGVNSLTKSTPIVIIP
jgi:hypothetical protein